MSGKNKEKQPYHHGDLRAALMRAALLLIDRHGIKGFSMKDAAAQAGVSIAAPYRHFADRDALLRAVQSEGFALFNASLAAAYGKAGAAREKIEELGVAYVRFALEHTAYFRVMFSLSGNASPEPEDPNASGFLLLVAAVAGLHPQASQELQRDLVLLFWSMVHGFALLEIDGAFDATVGPDDPERRLRRAVSRMLADVE